MQLISPGFGDALEETGLLISRIKSNSVRVVEIQINLQACLD